MTSPNVVIFTDHSFASRIPAGQLLESHSGIYTCTRTNEYGQAITEISVTVKPLVYEAAYRVSCLFVFFFVA